MKRWAGAWLCRIPSLDYAFHSACVPSPLEGLRISEPLLSPPSVFVARQPIFDAANRRVAYELLYRPNAYATTAEGISQDVMCSDTALHSVVSIGLDRLTGGALAFVNVTRDHLVNRLFKIFDPTTVVLELLETVDGDADVVEACQEAVACGYTLALDDYDGRPGLAVLLPLASIIKLDVLNKTADELRIEVERLRGHGLQLLAERVENHDMRDICLALGFELFQGYVFSRPETVGGRTISMQQTAMVSIMGMLNDTGVSEAELEEAFRMHPALTVALLRIVNSASFGARSVDSIPHAVRLIGREALSRWLMVMMVASLANDSPDMTEVVQQAMIRGRFAELVTLRGGSGDASARFLVGLLSCVDVLLAMPMSHVLEMLPVNPSVRDALLLQEGPHAAVLALVVAYERGDWIAVDAFTAEYGVDLDLANLFCESADWARERARVV